MKLYISGPIKGMDTAEILFSAAASDLTLRGYETLNPFDIKPICDCPPGTDLTDTGRHYNCYMRGDIAEMVACHGVALLDGWERSNGARLEQFVALSVGMRVMSLRSWIRAAAA